MSELRLVQNSQVISVFSGAEVQAAHVASELENMMAALARYHGQQTAQNMIADAFAVVWARWAEAQGPISARFALEVALDNAQRRAGLPATTGPNFFPDGGRAA